MADQWIEGVDDQVAVPFLFGVYLGSVSTKRDWLELLNSEEIAERIRERSGLELPDALVTNRHVEELAGWMAELMKEVLEEAQTFAKGMLAKAEAEKGKLGDHG